jgi:hypothetical protein
MSNTPYLNTPQYNSNPKFYIYNFENFYEEVDLPLFVLRLINNPSPSGKS